MVAAAKPPNVQIIRVYGLPKQMRVQTQEQADNMRVAAFDVREDVRRLASFPDDISPAEFKELRQRVGLLLTTATTCLENAAGLLETLVKMDIPVPDK